MTAMSTVPAGPPLPAAGEWTVADRHLPDGGRGERRRAADTDEAIPGQRHTIRTRHSLNAPPSALQHLFGSSAGLFPLHGIGSICAGQPDISDLSSGHLSGC
jgi:hypothetical protein